ncbi:MAG: GIY-YIG nuclease family protein [Rhodospirillales bacterium]|nr:GIY-YIG nuclease family protein [Rhodospirillales bacterium]MCB9995587.1 GIY-YIG nuclease family protein [Rhodospirillales bacterium]
MPENYYVYILTTRKNTALYIGVTSNLERRVWEHKQGLVEGFTKKYNINKLVHVEEYSDINEAIHREKCMKEWKRNWKIELIEKSNPEWNDLMDDCCNQIPAFAGMTS